MRRTERLFAIAEHLRGRRTGVTAEQLAERFDVTVRTIYRDLDTLRAAELPVNSERGRGGGYALDRSYSLPPVNFSAREAAVLVSIGEWMKESRLFPFAETLDSALDKVRSALGASAQRELLAFAATLAFVGVPAKAAPPAVRRAIEQAWFERQPLLVRYRSGDYVVTTRRVRIRAVVMERTVTFLNCDDLDKGEARQLRLDRIEHAENEPLGPGK